MFGFSRRHAFLIALSVIVCIGLMPTLSIGGDNDHKPDPEKPFENAERYEIDNPLGRKGVCRTVKGEPFLRDIFGQELRTRPKGPRLVIENKPLTKKRRGHCKGTSKGLKSGILFQPFGKTQVANGHTYYTIGWTCRKGEGHKCPDRKGQSGAVHGGAMRGDVSIFNQGTARSRPPGCIEDIHDWDHDNNRGELMCNGREAPNIYAKDGKNLSAATPDSSKHRSYVYKASPNRLSSQHGFFGIDDGIFRRANEYGYAGRFGKHYKSMIWSSFRSQRGGIVRGMLQRGAQFHRAAVSPLHVVTYNKKRKANGKIIFYYGYVEILRKGEGSNPISIDKHYGWTAATSRLKGHSQKYYLAAIPGESAPIVPTIPTMSPEFMDTFNFDAMAESEDLLPPDEQLESDGENIEIEETPAGPEVHSCGSCNDFGSREVLGNDNQILADVNGDGSDDAIGVTDDSWSVALSRNGRIGTPRNWNSSFGDVNEDEYVSDVTGDGKADAVSVDVESGAWSVARSSGTSFEDESEWGSGIGPNDDWQFLADVNGDGMSDVVSVSISAGKWTVAKSNGSSFGPPQVWKSGFGSDSSVPMVGDVDADGKNDAIVMDWAAGDWSVALANSNSFGTPSLWREELGADSDDQFVSDVTGDGRADVVLVDPETSEWKVSASSGTAFGVPTRWIGAIGSSDDMRMLGDANGDGLSDAATVSEVGEWQIAPSTGTSFTGYGPWLGSPERPTEFDTAQIVAGDLDDDGSSDAAWIDAGNNLRYAISNGSAFVEDDEFTENLGEDPRLLAGNVDGDSATELVVVNSDDDWLVFEVGLEGLELTGAIALGLDPGDETLLSDVDGDGDSDAIIVADADWSVAELDSGSFNAPVLWKSDFGGAGSRFLAGDTNGDGSSDAVEINSSTGVWRVAESSGSGFGVAGEWAEGFGVDSHRSLIGDVTGDGTADAVSISADTSNWSVAESDGEGAFVEPSRLMSTAGSGSSASLLADVSGDNSLDAIVVFARNNYWFVNTDTTKAIDPQQDAAKGFETSTNWLSEDEGAGKALSGDVDGDGRSDAVLFDTNSGILSVATSDADPPGGFGDGAGYVQWATGVQTWHETATLADFNGDGKDDFAVVSPTYFDGINLKFTSDWDIWISDGESFEKNVGLFDSSHDMELYKFKDFAVDVNADGRADAVQVDQTGDVLVALSDGDSLLPSTVWYQEPVDGDDLEPQNNSIADDFDGDGKADILTSPIDGEWWLLRAANGKFEPDEEPLADSFEPAVSISGDVSGDGIADLIGVDSAEGEWTVLDSDGEFADSPEVWIDSFGASGDQAITSDVNGDGQADAINYSPLSPGANWSVGIAKRTAPTTVLSSGPVDGSTVRETEVEWTFSSLSATEFECRTDLDSWSTCTSPYTPSSLSDGEHTFSVRALAGGIAELNPAEIQFVVDSVAPDTSITSGPSGGATIFLGDPVYEFESTDPSAKFSCVVDAGDPYPCKSPHKIRAAGDGSHEFTVGAVDEAGNADDSPATAAFEVSGSSGWVDTSLDSGPSSPSTEHEIEFEFSASGNDSFECRLDSGDWDECTSPLRIALDLVSENHLFEVRSVTDGFVDPTPASLNWFADLELPQVEIESPASGADLESGEVEIEFSSSHPIVESLCTIDDQEPVVCEEEDMLELDSTGSHSLIVSVENAAGNVGSAIANFTVMSGLETTVSEGPAPTTSNEAEEFLFESSSVSALFECRLDDQPWDACESPEVVDLTGAEDGEHVFHVRSIVDGVHDSEGDVWPFYVDTAAPTAPTLSPVEEITSDFTPVFEIAHEDETVSFECSTDGAEPSMCPPLFETGELNDGIHSVSVEAVDEAGNRSDAVSETVEIDTSGPSVVIVSGKSDRSDPTPEFDFYSDEDASYECAVDEGVFEVCESPFETASLSSGSHEFSVRATDALGNPSVEWGSSMATTFFTVSAVDGTAPVVTAGPTSSTSDTTPTFEFEPGTGSVPDSFHCRIDDYLPDECEDDFTTWYPLADGEHVFKVWGQFNSGDVTPVESVEFEIASGLTAPETVADSPTTVSVSPGERATFNYHSSAGARFFCKMREDTMLGGAVPPAIPPLVDTWVNRCISPYRFDGWYGSQGLQNVAYVTDVWAVSDGGVDPSPLRLTTFVKGLTPALQILEAPESTIEETTARFRFRSTDPSVESFECGLDGEVYEDCRSPLVVEELSDGSHTFSVRAVDTFGNHTQEIVTFEVDAGVGSGFDSAAPNTFVAFSPTTKRVNGYVAVDDVAINFYANETATFSCRIDSEPFDDCGSTHWFYGLSDGQHTVEVVAIDGESNADVSPAVLEFEIDTVVPDIAIAYPANGKEIHDPDVQVDVDSDDGVQFSCVLDQFTIASMEDCGPEHVHFPNISLGSHMLFVFTMDKAGHVNYAMSMFNYRTAPETTITSGPTENETLSGDSTEFGFSSSDPDAEFMCELDTGGFSSCSSPEELTSLSSGSHTFRVYAVSPDETEDPTPAQRTFVVP